MAQALRETTDISIELVAERSGIGSAHTLRQHYQRRFGIECVNREVKQCLGAEDPQSWKGEGPERAASVSLWLYAAIWTWYIPTVGTARSWIPRPWYPKKATPSFLDALASLRRVLWAERITPVSSSQPLPPQILDGLLDALATAA